MHVGVHFCLGVELQGHSTYIIFSIIGYCQTVFLSSSCLTFLSTLSGVFQFILTSHITVSKCGFSFISLISNMIEHFSYVLTGLWVSCEISVQLLTHFSIGWTVLFCIDFLVFIYCGYKFLWMYCVVRMYVIKQEGLNRVKFINVLYSWYILFKKCLSTPRSRKCSVFF